VPRTFAEYKIAQFRTPEDSRQNPLYNVLAAYAKHCPEVGYTQGMNFLCGLILIGVDFNELHAFVILEKLMGEYADLASLYSG
jgi:TBC1 domain family member 10